MHRARGCCFDPARYRVVRAPARSCAGTLRSHAPCPPTATHRTHGTPLPNRRRNRRARSRHNGSSAVPRPAMRREIRDHSDCGGNRPAGMVAAGVWEPSSSCQAADVGGISNSGELSVPIDAVSAQASIASDLLAEVSRDGTANIESTNNDWTIPKLRGWKDASQGVVIQPAQSSDTGETVYGAAESVALRHCSRFASMTSSC